MRTVKSGWMPMLIEVFVGGKAVIVSFVMQRLLFAAVYKVKKPKKNVHLEDTVQPGQSSSLII